MKCSQCGATNLTLQDEFCPYCGALNIAAKQHVEDMKHYSQRYEDTEAEVTSNVSRQITFHSQLILVVILIIFNVALFALRVGADDIRWWIKERNINAHAKEHVAKLSEYEESREYMLLRRYYNEVAWGSGEITGFDILSDMAYSYSRITEAVYYLNHDEVESYQTKEELLEEIASALTRYYESWDYQDSPYFEGNFTDKHVEAMEQLGKDIEVLIKSNFNLNDEDVEKLPRMREVQIVMLLGKELGIYE